MEHSGGGEWSCEAAHKNDKNKNQHYQQDMNRNENKNNKTEQELMQQETRGREYDTYLHTKMTMIQDRDMRGETLNTNRTNDIDRLQVV